MGEAERKIIPWPRIATAGGFAGGPEGRARWPGMRVLAFVSAEKGSGKTTLAAQTAVMAEIAGAGPVAIIDTDPRGKLADWWNERQEEYPAFVHTAASRIGEDLPRLRELGIKTCVIDTPPTNTTMIEHVADAVDIVAIPCRPDAQGLRAAGSVVELVERLHGRLGFVINAATPGARITAEAGIALSYHGTVAPVTIHHRNDFAASMIDGRTVMEIDWNCASAQEIVQLWQHLDERLAQLIH